MHFVRLGDTTLQQDVRIDRLLHNDIAGLGNRFPIEVEIGSQDCPALPGSPSPDPGHGPWKPSNSPPVEAPAKATFLVEASAPGLQRYTVTVAEAEGETNLENNRRTLTVDVIERKKRILITSTAPHPDRGAWANALSANANYEVVQKSVESSRRVPCPTGRGMACSSSASIRETETAGTCLMPSARTVGPSGSSWTLEPTSAPWPTSESASMSGPPELD